MIANRQYRVALFGAAPDTPNMGVSALFFSTVSGIARFLNDVEFVVFDNGLGEREERLNLPSGKAVRLICFGARGGHRYHRAENLASMLFASRLGALGARLNEGIRLVDTCDAVVDASGGDSFSDIYGMARFNNVCRPKVIAVNRNKPLILLPQTYGPYSASKATAKAASATRGARMAWARDQNSYENLKNLLGERFDKNIHRCGVDMAFSLPATPAAELLDPSLQSWLANSAPDIPLVGFNVSGLIYNDPDSAIKRYGFKANYRQLVFAFIKMVLTETSARVVLISHVMDQPGHYESDFGACAHLAEQLGERYSDRVAIAPACLNQSQAKWLISNMDWFCGTRMHSTIAGLSSGVPTAAISYSDKTKGVFDTCGQRAQVFDPRVLDDEGIVNGLWQAYLNRDRSRQSLALFLPDVREIAVDQMASIASFIQGNATSAISH